MFKVVQVMKVMVLVLVLACLVAACGDPSAPPPQPSPTTPPTAMPSPAAPQSTAGAPVSTDLTALLTQVRGGVTVSDGTGASMRHARPMQVLSASATVYVAAGAQVGLICSSEQWVDLAGELDWQLTEVACDTGRALPPGSYQSMAPQAGRILSLEGSMTIESETREKEGDYGRIPIVLSPRNTSLLELEPELHWVEVSGTIEYVLKMSGSQALGEITLDAVELTCREGTMVVPNGICSVPWPASEWSLDRGQRYFLTISARTGIASEPRSSGKSALRTLTGDAAGEVQAAVAAIGALDLDAVTQSLMLANLYAGHGLLKDAICAYELALAVQPSPEVYVALGDSYSEVALYRWAFHAYRKALDMLSQSEDDLAVRAAAEFGIGRVYYNYAENYAEAAEHFAKAVQLYQELEAAEWLEAAQRGLEETRKRSP